MASATDAYFFSGSFFLLLPKTNPQPENKEKEPLRERELLRPLEVDGARTAPERAAAFWRSFSAAISASEGPGATALILLDELELVDAAGLGRSPPPDILLTMPQIQLCLLSFFSGVRFRPPLVSFGFSGE